MHRDAGNESMKPALFLLLILACLIVVRPDLQAAESPSQYTFSWPLTGSDSRQPRGGTTRGAPVELENSPSPAWQALQEPGLSSFERDRRAVLAMAGEYRVTFDFLEVATFAPGLGRARPYQSWATEKIYVDRDEDTFISLLHILEMRFVQEDGSIGEPMVAKHWRQDWRYEPAQIIEYKGGERQERRELPPATTRGMWSQTVYEIDESPRYASIGRWEHSPVFSSWQSGETWRPLPGREARVRDDYDVLIGTNRHTVHPAGWLHEENNLKTQLPAMRQPLSSPVMVAREYGVARYERIRNMDFTAADRLYGKERKTWLEEQSRGDRSH